MTVAGSLAYETPAGETVTDILDTTFEANVDRRGQAYAQPSVAKTVALAVLVSGMKEAAERYAETPRAATKLMKAVTTRFEADAETLDDDALEGEITFALDLLALMEQGAPQGTLYREF